ncbi:MAG TPA: AAA family ATPase, partial [Anaerovoracaceae bacterium]|nr:AAA family ATPase [Anaerovoracaceae bacterium]
MEERIKRPTYLNKLIEYKDKDIIKIITGIRRCGKSTLLDLYEDYLLGHGIKAENILHMNLESLQHRDLLSYLPFYDYVSNHIVKGERNYLIFDELQVVTHWEKAIESFR